MRRILSSACGIWGPMMRVTTPAILALLMSLVTSPIAAQDSREYAMMARAAWSAFECSSLASKSNDPQEQERLFLFGYDQGKRFLAAAQAGEIEQEHLSSEAPLMLLLLLEGPSHDFMLGRIFEAAQDDALEDVFKTGEYFNSAEDQVLAAKNKFWRLNCNLLGR